MWEETIRVEPPYDFMRVLDRLSLDPLNNLNKKESSVKIPLRLENDNVIVTIKSMGNKLEPVFHLSSTGDKEKSIARVKHILSWNKPLHNIQGHFLQTNLRELFIEHEGTPLILDFSLYGSMMKCIIHQQLNLAFAHTLTKRFVQLTSFEKEGVWFPPTPEDVAKLPYEALRELQFSQRKAEYVIDTSRLIAEGRLDLEALRDQGNEEILDRLIQIRGIGAWTVQNILLFGLGRENLFPKADIGIQNAMKKYFKLGTKPTHDQMELLSREWDPYKSYASLYLWRSIEP